MDRGTGGTATLVAGSQRELDDDALVAEVRQGDDAAFEALYERYLRRITAYVKGMVHDHGRAEDVTQEVFISALRRMRETERPIAFKPWIYEIARNACIDHHRRSRRAEEVSFDAAQGLGRSDHLRLVSTEPTPHAAVESKQQLADLRGAFRGLSQSHHDILVLRELEGRSYREIGDRMSLSRPAVESTLFRARRRLVEEYDDLISGRRCERVQAIICAAAEGMLGARDRRRLDRHLLYCRPCRHHAVRMGMADVAAARTVGAGLAALLPIPAFLRGAGSGSAASGSAAAGGSGRHGHASTTLAQWAAAAAPAAEPVTGSWAKAAATVATMAALGMGAGISSHSGAITLLTPKAPSHGAAASTFDFDGGGAPGTRMPAARPPAMRAAPIRRDAGASAPARRTPPSPRHGRPGRATRSPADHGAPPPGSSTGSGAAPAAASRPAGVAPARSVAGNAPARALPGGGHVRTPSISAGASVGLSTPVAGAQVRVVAPNLVEQTAALAQAVVYSVPERARDAAAPTVGS